MKHIALFRIPTELQNVDGFSLHPLNMICTSSGRAISLTSSIATRDVHRDFDSLEVRVLLDIFRAIVFDFGERPSNASRRKSTTFETLDRPYYEGVLTFGFSKSSSIVAALSNDSSWRIIVSTVTIVESCRLVKTEATSTCEDGMRSLLVRSTHTNPKRSVLSSPGKDRPFGISVHLSAYVRFSNTYVQHG